MSEACQARGKARYQPLEERSQGHPTLDPPVSKVLKDTRRITKILDRPPKASLTDRDSTDTDRAFCKTWRRLFQGTGDYAVNMLQDNTRDVYFSHWHGHHLPNPRATTVLYVFFCGEIIGEIGPWSLVGER
jgi:hypothetical protein